MTQAAKLDPTIIVIFGITGDLSQRYLLPALYHLFQAGLFHEKTRIVGLSRQDLDASHLLSRLLPSGQTSIYDPVVLETIQSKTDMLQFDPNVGDDYAKLLQHLNELEERQGLCMDRLYYLSIPPQVFSTTVGFLGQYGLNTSCLHNRAQTRLLVEKPFGSDLASSRQLIEETAQIFAEEQIFRIDHYLAKENAQNILTFRARNPIFASLWNNQHIAAIDVTVKEKIGIEGRVNFYEGLGALRDFVQSHLLQLLAITTMDMPKNLTSHTIHESKEALFKNIRSADPKEAVRGQYHTYRQEVANPVSTTETYVKLKLQIDNKRWEGVPLTIATGKALDERKTEITVTFADKDNTSTAVNRLVFRIQPNEGIHLQLKVKKPGFAAALEDTQMNFRYEDIFGAKPLPNAYEHVLVDAIKGDRTLFASSTEVLESWRILQPIIEAWRDNNQGMLYYQDGASDPETIT